MHAFSLFLSLMFWQNEVASLWTGSDSKVTTAGIKLVTDQETWTRTWFGNQGNKAGIKELDTRRLPGSTEKDLGQFVLTKGVPEVNFNSYVVLAVFGGRKEPAYGYSVHSTHREGDTFELWIRAVGAPAGELPYQPDYAKPGNLAYGFFLLPRNFKRITVLSGIFEGTWSGHVSLGTLELRR